jgi:DNA-binding beta-propeller fold protein YncE
MRRISGSLVALVVASAGLLAASARPSSSDGDDQHGRHKGRNDTVWVVNRDQGTLMVFDAETGGARIPAPIPSGTGAHDVVISHQTRKAFVMNELENTVAVFSTSTLERLDTIPLGPRPHHAKVSENGQWVYIGLFGTSKIAVMDTRTHEVVEYLSGEGTGLQAHAPRPSHNGRFIFVPHEVGNVISKLRARTGRILASVNPGDTTGGQPTEVLPTRDGQLLYVAMRNEGKIKTVDLATFTMTGQALLVGTQPESLILTPDERTLVVSMRGSPAKLTFVDTEGLSLDGTVALGGAGTFGDLAVPSADGRFVYATFDAGAANAGGVAKVDVERRTVESWSYPGVGRPHGVAYSMARLQAP